MGDTYVSKFPRFLVNPKKDHDLRKWAAEGLSFLSLDGDVKENIINDPTAIQALIELAKVRQWDGLKTKEMLE